MDALLKLGIDWRGVLLYLVNFGIIFIVLGKLLYKPLLKFLDERQKNIGDNLREAEELKKTLAAETKRRDEEAKQLVVAMKLEIDQAKADAAKRAEAMVKEAEETRAKMILEAKDLINAMRANLHAEVAAEVKNTVKKAVTEILKNKVSEDVIESSATEALADIKS